MFMSIKQNARINVNLKFFSWGDDNKSFQMFWNVSKEARHVMIVMMHRRKYFSSQRVSLLDFHFKVDLF